MRTYDVAAYIWPAYSGDDQRSRIFWPDGYGEWQSLNNAVTKCEKHSWPRKPLWGYVNEGDPYVMEMEIEAATDHGINVFVYDWYWYDNRPFLENCLNDGFLKARNRDKMRFYLMWANHSGRYNWDIRNATQLQEPNSIWTGRVDAGQFRVMSDRIIEKYFKEPNYYKIDGCPVFSIYDLPNLFMSFGGLTETRRALDGFRERCIKAGFPGLHLQIIDRARYDVGELNIHLTKQELIEALGVDSMTGYGNGYYTGTDIPYEETLPKTEEYLAAMDNSAIPYFPSVSLGWDNNPRYGANTLMPNIITGRTPEKFARVLEITKAYLDSHPTYAPLVIINAWNEWTEDNYLQPDDVHGYEMLEAVKKTFID